MQNQACLNVEIYRAPVSRRTSQRRVADTAASLRSPKSRPEAIRLLDISPEGCGFESRWPFSAGSRVWLRLPGLEPWEAMVVWFEDGRGGLVFARPLHPAVAIRFAI